MFEESYTFDDVLLVPQYSEINSRSDVDISVELVKGFKFSSPIIPANMKTITEFEMAKKLYEMKTLGILHRFMTFNEKIKMLEKVKRLGTDVFNYIGMSVGMKNEDKTELDAFINLGTKIICIDVAHIDCKNGLEFTKYVANKYPNVLLIAGNVATKEGTYRVFIAGADVCKTGIGAGSICTTRIETGCGLAQLTSVMLSSEAKKMYESTYNKKVFIISDGGIVKPADACKALCFSNLVMAGNIFASTDETPGELFYPSNSNILHKKYDGSSTHKINRIEGVKSIIPYKGSVNDVFTRFHEGIQSACSYSGAKNLKEFKEKCKFMKITSHALRESNHHDVIVI